MPAEVIALYKTLLTVRYMTMVFSTVFMTRETVMCINVHSDSHCRHVCGVQIGRPRRRAMAILIVSLSILSPSAIMGRTWSQAPA